MAKLEKGINDLLTLHPDIAKEWDYERNGDINPSDVTSGSKKKIWWKCSTCGNEWEAVIYSRAISGSGCPICSRKKQGVSFRRQRIAQNGSLKETHPILCLEWDYSTNCGKSPNDYSAGSNENVYWKCKKCGNTWSAKISKTTNQQTGCPKCAVEERSRKKSKMVKCIDNDMLFDSVNAASEYAQVSASKISACCRGKQKTAGGYHWEYYDSRD